jgi:uncharacterized protein
VTSQSHSPDRGAIAELLREEIDSFLREQRIARLGCHAGGVTYVVPVIYAYDGESVYSVTTEGQKVAMMRESPRVCVEVDEYDADGRGSWRSVIGYGDYEELGGEDVELALAALRDAFGRGAPAEPRALGPGVVAFRIRLDELTGRAVTR